MIIKQLVEEEGQNTNQLYLRNSYSETHTYVNSTTDSFKLIIQSNNLVDYPKDLDEKRNMVMKP